MLAFGTCSLSEGTPCHLSASTSASVSDVFAGLKAHKKWMVENELSVYGSVEEKRSHFERSAVTFLDICLNPKKACEENFGKGFFFSLNFSFF